MREENKGLKHFLIATAIVFFPLLFPSYGLAAANCDVVKANCVSSMVNDKCDNECADVACESDSVVIDCLAGESSAAATASQGSKAQKYGLSHTADTSTLPKNDDLAAQAGSLISSILEYVAILFLGLILYGGFLWMTARGQGEKVTQAKNVIINAVLGLVVVAAAYAITTFVITAVVG